MADEHEGIHMVMLLLVHYSQKNEILCLLFGHGPFNISG